MKSLGGAIKVDSTEGKGTTFHLAIPVRHIAGTSAYTNEEGVETSMFVTEGDNKTKEDKVSTTNKETTATILVVEDNADVAAYIGKRLSGKYKIVYAQNGEHELQPTVPQVLSTDRHDTGSVYPKSESSKGEADVEPPSGDES